MPQCATHDISCGQTLALLHPPMQICFALNVLTLLTVPTVLLTILRTLLLMILRTVPLTVLLPVPPTVLPTIHLTSPLTVTLTMVLCAVALLNRTKGVWV